VRLPDRRRRSTGVVRGVLLLALATVGGISQVASDAPRSFGPEKWEGTFRFAPMPGCDFGPAYGRSGGYFTLKVDARLEGNTLSIGLPHAPTLGVWYLHRRANLALTGDIEGHLKSGHSLDASGEVTLTCLGTAERAPLPSEVRKERLTYKGELALDEKPPNLNLSTKVTLCPDNACSIGLTLKVKRVS